MLNIIKRKIYLYSPENIREVHEKQCRSPDLTSGSPPAVYWMIWMEFTANINTTIEYIQKCYQFGSFLGYLLLNSIWGNGFNWPFAELACNEERHYKSKKHIHTSFINIGCKFRRVTDPYSSFWFRFKYELLVNT